MQQRSIEPITLFFDSAGEAISFKSYLTSIGEFDPKERGSYHPMAMLERAGYAFDGHSKPGAGGSNFQSGAKSPLERPVDQSQVELFKSQLPEYLAQHKKDGSTNLKDVNLYESLTVDDETCDYDYSFHLFGNSDAQQAFIATTQTQQSQGMIHSKVLETQVQEPEEERRGPPPEGLFGYEIIVAEAVGSEDLDKLVDSVVQNHFHSVSSETLNSDMQEWREAIKWIFLVSEKKN